MLEAAEKVQIFLKDKTLEDFLKDDMLRAAVERNLGIIGEAARASLKNSNRSIRKFPGGRSLRSAMC